MVKILRANAKKTKKGKTAQAPAEPKSKISKGEMKLMAANLSANSAKALRKIGNQKGLRGALAAKNKKGAKTSKSKKSIKKAKTPVASDEDEDEDDDDADADASSSDDGDVPPKRAVTKKPAGKKVSAKKSKSAAAKENAKDSKDSSSDEDEEADTDDSDTEEGPKVPINDAASKKKKGMTLPKGVKIRDPISEATTGHFRHHGSVQPQEEEPQPR